MAEIREYFIGGFLCQGGVPNDDALGGAEAVDGSIGHDGFVAGLHPEHTLGGNFLAGAAGHALEFGDELQGLGVERFVLVEEGIDHVGRYKHAEEKEWQRNDPEIEPPAARALADNGIENPHEQAANDDGKELGLGPISGPRSEERRVGKECRARWSPDHEKKKERQKQLR